MSTLFGDQVRLPVTSSAMLSRIEVEGLFGRPTSYDLPVRHTVDGSPSRLALLYGDNGSGKTTILQMVWNLLSPEGSSGHRTALARTPFKNFRVTLSDGTRITASKLKDVVGSYELTIAGPNVQRISVTIETDSRNSISMTRVGEEEYGALLGHVSVEEMYRQGLLLHSSDTEIQHSRMLEYLTQSGFNPVFLADDRSLYSEDAELRRLREREARERRYSENERIARGVPGRNESVYAELRLSISRVNDLLRGLLLRGQTDGSAGANSIYGDILRRLAGARLQPIFATLSAPEKMSYHAAERLLLSLRDQSPRFEQFGLIPKFDADEFLHNLRSVDGPNRELAVEIVTPYLNSLVARMTALADAERTIRKLVELLNEFLVDKQFSFTPSEGLRINTSMGSRLSPERLSSGERQLVMLVLTTLLTSRDSRIFLIDEPELSLGIPWQSRIMSALLELTDDTDLQFLVATHSVEMVTSERENLVRLSPQRNALF